MPSCALGLFLWHREIHRPNNWSVVVTFFSPARHTSEPWRCTRARRCEVPGCFGHQEKSGAQQQTPASHLARLLKSMLVGLLQPSLCPKLRGIPIRSAPLNPSFTSIRSNLATIIQHSNPASSLPHALPYLNKAPENNAHLGRSEVGFF